MLDLAVTTALGVAFLWMFYVAMRVDWPEQYFATTDFSAYAVSSSPLRYALFRFAPVFVACVVVAVTLDRRGSEWGTSAAVSVAAIHGFGTLGVALIAWMRSEPKRRSHRASIALIRAVALVGVLGVSIVAAATRPLFAALIPGATELNGTLWTAGLAAVAGAFVAQYSRAHGISEASLIARALGSLPTRLRDTAAQVSREEGADVDLVMAVMAVENLQRPPWFRQLEHLKSRIFRSGTYGIMQVSSRLPLTDEESIRIAVSTTLAKVSVKNRQNQLDTEALKHFASEYNGGPTYYSTLLQAYLASRRSTSPTPSADLATPRVTTAADAAPAKSPSLTRDQCMFCAERMSGSAPAVAISDAGAAWAPTADALRDLDVALTHPHCYAVQRGIDAVARLKRTFDSAGAG